MNIENTPLMETIKEEKKEKYKNIQQAVDKLTTNLAGSDVDKPNLNNLNNSIKQERAKFLTIQERNGVFNSDDNINTDTSSEIYDSKNNITHQQPTLPNVYEFSVSTLDRKLKQIRKLNKDNYKRTRRYSISNNYNNVESEKSPHMDIITIMINPSKLINEHLNEIQLRIIGHTRSAIMYEKREKFIGYPVTILSSFITSSIMMSITSDKAHDKDIIKYISLTLSVVSFLFSVSRDYLNFSRKFQSHDLSSKLYTTLLRSTEVRLIKNHIDESEKRDIFKDLVDQMSIIEQYEIPIPGKIDRQVRKQHNMIEKASY